MREMLSELKKHYELILFTASQSDYANKVIDVIEKDEKYFDHRLVHDDCLLSKN